MLLSEIARDRGIRYFLISFTDLFGTQRAKMVPAQAIDLMAVDGAGFAGFAAWLDMTPAPDILAIPDASQMIQALVIAATIVLIQFAFPLPDGLNFD
jgi:glutamine synthetase